MNLSERQAMWHDRICAFKDSGETNVAAWCRNNNINVKSMYNWLKKESSLIEQESKETCWIPVQTIANDDVPSSITLKIGQFSVDVKENFNPTLLNEVIGVIQGHVK